MDSDSESLSSVSSVSRYSSPLLWNPDFTDSVEPDYFEIISQSKKKNKKFNVDTNEYNIRLVNLISDRLSPNELLIRAFNQFISFITNEYDENYFIGISIMVPTSRGILPAGIPFGRIGNLSAEMIIDLLESLSQSSGDFSDTDLLEFKVQVVHNLRGGAP